MKRRNFVKANAKAGFHKIRAVFSGYHQQDYCNVYNGLHYVQINNISYRFWHKDNDWGFTRCKEPIWAFVTIYENGIMKITGRQSEYKGGLKAWKNDPGYDGYPTVPLISDRDLKITV